MEQDCLLSGFSHWEQGLQERIRAASSCRRPKKWLPGGRGLGSREAAPAGLGEAFPGAALCSSFPQLSAQPWPCSCPRLANPPKQSCWGTCDGQRDLA